MNKHITDEELLAYLEGEELDKLENHLRECPDCKKRLDQYKLLVNSMESSREAEPAKSLKWEFLAAIEEEKKSLTKDHRIWYKVAAFGALLLVSFFAGKWSVTDSTEKIAAIENEVAELKTLTFQQMVTSQSASQRITAVNRMESVVADRSLVMTLIKLLNTDESPNVRYAAVQALGKMMEDDLVKSQLVKALEVQTDPLIQIALISILTEAKEKSAIAPVKDLIKNENTSPEVKRQAEIALQLLI